MSSLTAEFPITGKNISRVITTHHHGEMQHNLPPLERQPCDPQSRLWCTMIPEDSTQYAADPTLRVVRDKTQWLIQFLKSLLP